MLVLGFLVAFAVTAFSVVLKQIVDWIDERIDDRQETRQPELRSGRPTAAREHDSRVAER